MYLPETISKVGNISDKLMMSHRTLSTNASFYFECSLANTLLYSKPKLELQSSVGLQMKTTLINPSGLTGIWKFVCLFASFRLRLKWVSSLRGTHAHICTEELLFPPWCWFHYVLLYLDCDFQSSRQFSNKPFRNLLWSPFWQSSLVTYFICYFRCKSPSKTVQEQKRGTASKYGES